ncbi:MAG: hypothetical protein GY820_40070 [Gammaproteobacteria bacterium]|nr:hypothetical protein [Gammaproteobacteria bacterium]
MARLTFTISDDLAFELDTLSHVLGCSTSALVNLIVSERLSYFQDRLESIEAVPSDIPILKRARGDSLLSLEEQYREFLDEFDTSH